MRRKSHSGGLNVRVTYPESVVRRLDALMADWRLPIDAVLARPLGGLSPRPRPNASPPASQIHRADGPATFGGLTLVSRAAWRLATGKPLPTNYVVVVLDGNPDNAEHSNLYCLPLSMLQRWVRFARSTYDIRISQLEEEVMTLDTSEAVKRELLKILAQVVDPDQRPDIIRQRAACETVQALVGVLKAEVSYIRALDGDGIIPFLEEARTEAVARRKRTRQERLQGPAPGHPWRGLGR